MFMSRTPPTEESKETPMEQKEQKTDKADKSADGESDHEAELNPDKIFEGK